MFLKHIDLTTALRPSYLPDEVLLFVQDNVGLYEGKFKLPNQQNGQVYLTSHRICYVDKNEPRASSVALDLKEVDRYDFYAGFLKSSPKITIIPKPLKRSSLHSRAISHAASPSRTDSASPARRDSAYRPPSEPPPLTTAHWVCTICSFSNPIPVNFDPAAANAHTPLPPCLACGIKPTLSHVLKAAISNASNRPSAAPGAPNVPCLAVRPKALDFAFQASRFGDSTQARDVPDPKTDPTASFQCPRCTFSNHPSLLSCEMCCASLLSQSIQSITPDTSDAIRTQSPGPVMDYKGKAGPGGIDISDSVKVSFRGGGEKIFHERLKGAMTQRKWLLQNAPPPPNSSRMMDDGGANESPDGSSGSRTKTAGIAGLEQLGLNMRKNNELLIGSAFEDLEALMSSAKEVIALAERFARQNNGANGGVSAEENAILAESASQLGLVTTKDIVGGGSSESLYLSELSRNMAEFLADDSRGVLKQAGGIITLVDLWAMFNRARGGVELVSPMDFEKAARLWESLKLPIRLRTFRSGVMVVQGRDRTDETTIKALLSWLQDLHEFPPDRDVAWDWREFGRGVTAQEAAERFGWSIGVAEEELLMAEEHGALCREEGLEGLKFWQNYIDTGDIPLPKSESQLREEALGRSLRASGFI
ncbi:Vacuolar protein-sorting-associated protein 36 [Tolypocladium ophioglossoides CBS 100239]|uniref:Vacuolar protein-sorting-associated protein 36 n=1 Tax=Tolypocladium ophioglossoides (strain CBS 100239) TaxID=1163406 RepID=A0A0L0N7C9_TOLOC|nr:Vacuolar protein-sorting-associated protein 36 [Tolypocladium ophioglossoides CBS 100239]